MEYLRFNKRIVDIEDFDPEVLHIFSPEALRRIKSGDDGWESMVPDFVDQIIKNKCLFGYCGTPADSSRESGVANPADAAARAIGQAQP